MSYEQDPKGLQLERFFGTLPQMERVMIRTLIPANQDMTTNRDYPTGEMMYFVEEFGADSVRDAFVCLLSPDTDLRAKNAMHFLSRLNQVGTNKYDFEVISAAQEQFIDRYSTFIPKIDINISKMLTKCRAIYEYLGEDNPRMLKQEIERTLLHPDFYGPDDPSVRNMHQRRVEAWITAVLSKKLPREAKLYFLQHIEDTYADAPELDFSKKASFRQHYDINTVLPEFEKSDNRTHYGSGKSDTYGRSGGRNSENPNQNKTSDEQNYIPPDDIPGTEEGRLLREKNERYLEQFGGHPLDQLQIDHVVWKNLTPDEREKLLKKQYRTYVVPNFYPKLHPSSPGYKELDAKYKHEQFIKRKNAYDFLLDEENRMQAEF